MNYLLTAIGAGGQTLTIPHIEYSSIIPEILLVVTAMLLLLASAMTPSRIRTQSAALVTVAAGVAAVVATYRMWQDLNTSSIHSTIGAAIADDHFALFFAVAIASALVLSALVSSDWLTRRAESHDLRTGDPTRGGPELFVLMMLSASGAMLMAAANDLIIVFLGLEILSIALYALVAFNRHSEASREGAMKYFILGSFSSAIFLYGIALTYGATGTTNLSAIAKFLSDNTLLDNGLLLGGMALLAVGFAFKIAAVPFHQWTPDVYQGAPTPVTGFMAAAAKAGAFAALIRVFGSTFYVFKLDWTPIILALAVVTLLIGSIVACVQQNVKRMLAYSSISHAGFILLGLQAGSQDGFAGALFYLLVYTFMVIGSFAIVSLVENASQDTEHPESASGIEAFRGLGRRQPGIALTFSVLLLAQAGVPLTAGFLAKFYVISALVENGSYETAVFAMLVAAIAAYFYLRIVIVMYSAPATRVAVQGGDTGIDTGGIASATTPYIVLPVATAAVLIISLVFTIGVGVLPPSVSIPPMSHLVNFIKLSHQAAGDFFTS